MTLAEIEGNGSRKLLGAPIQLLFHPLRVGQGSGQGQHAVFYADINHTYTPEEIATLLDRFDLELDLDDCSALGLIRGHRNEENDGTGLRRLAAAVIHPGRTAGGSEIP